MRNVLLIIGPPGSGKTTYAQTTGLTHLEREHYPTDQLYRQAAQAAAAHDDANVAIIRCCPTHQEQHEWEQLTNPTKVIVLNLEPNECARRIHQRHRPNWRGEVQAARQWHKQRAAMRATSRTW